MRGKGLVDCAAVIIVGITPAYAGKSFAEWIDEQGEEDHPRLCGEKGAFSPFGSSDKGSPPPMRGKGFDVPVIQRQDGITPAYAGKSGIVSLYAEFFQDHPRLCGEKSIPAAAFLNSAGSPPPMRGKAHACTSKKHRRRITPAYAGKSRNGVFVRIAL